MQFILVYLIISLDKVYIFSFLGLYKKKKGDEFY